MAKTNDTFKKLYEINVNDKTETKEGLTYLSWSWAWAIVKLDCPDATYNIKRFENGLPYVYDANTGYMVFTDVTIDGTTHEMWLPVMDSHNRAMKSEPYTITTKYGKEIRVEAATMFDINKTIMRCLVKNLAVFGLGLYIYAGQDLPDVDMSDDEKKAEIKRLIQQTGTDTVKYLAAMGTKFKKEFKSVDEMSGAELDYALGRIIEKARMK